MTTSSKASRALDVLFYLVTAIIFLNFVSVCVGCVAAKPACAVINLADMVCETVAVEYVDPQTGKKAVINVKKAALTGAVNAAVKAEAQK